MEMLFGSATADDDIQLRSRCYDAPDSNYNPKLAAKVDLRNIAAEPEVK